MERTFFTAKFHLEFITAIGYGGSSRIVMFHQQKTIKLTLRDILAWNYTGFIQIPNVANINPKNIHQTDESSFSAAGVLQLQKADDSIEYYKGLIKKGWRPNASASKAIQSFGYPNFRPEKF